MYTDLEFDDPLLEGFAVLEAPPEAPSELSRFMSASAYFIDNLASDEGIDPHTCALCVERLTDLMKERLKEMEQECDSLQKYLQDLETEPCDIDLEQLEKQLKNLLEEEERLKHKLSIEKESEKEIDSEIHKEKEILKEYEMEELKCSKQICRYVNEMISLEEESITLNNKLTYTKDKLKAIDNINVFTSTFHIWYSENFGTVNNFRLGYLSSNTVNWNEINAAWGQVCLLVSALAKKMNINFKKFRPVPCGNHSYIEVVAKKKKLPLYGSGSFKFRWDDIFDQGMAAFLECLLEMKESKIGKSVICFPYRIEKGSLRDGPSGKSYSVKIRFNSEEHWTKSLKFLVTNLKWALMAVPLLDKESEKWSKKKVKSVCYGN